MSTNQASIFAPETFLDATTTEESVKRPPLPAGKELPALLKGVKARTWQGKQDPTKSGIAIDVTHEFDLAAFPEIRQLVGGLDKVTISDSIMLDLTDSGSIDYAPGKNTKLRRYREATGMNVAGQAFSPRMLEGRMVRSMIGHRPNPNDPSDVYEEIKSIAKL